MTTMLVDRNNPKVLASMCTPRSREELLGRLVRKQKQATTTARSDAFKFLEIAQRARTPVKKAAFLFRAGIWLATSSVDDLGNSAARLADMRSAVEALRIVSKFAARNDGTVENIFRSCGRDARNLSSIFGSKPSANAIGELATDIGQDIYSETRWIAEQGAYPAWVATLPIAGRNDGLLIKNLEKSLLQ